MWFRDHGAEVALEIGLKRSSRWKKARREHLKKQPWCVACKKQHNGLFVGFLRFFRGVQVHHIFPFHIVRALDRGDLECDSRNCVTLCKDHHRVLGHFNDWNSYNPYVKHLAIRFFGRPIRDILNDPEWLRFREERKRDIRFLSSVELSELRAKLDEKLPIRA